MVEVTVTQFPGFHTRSGEDEDHKKEKVLYCREEGERGSSAALSSGAAALLRPNGAIHNIYVIVKVIVNISLLRKADSRKEYGRLSEKDCVQNGEPA